ncbi:MAG: polyprenyl synthetase family protein [Pyrinomonadaceae bacterium]
MAVPEPNRELEGFLLDTRRRVDATLDELIPSEEETPRRLHEAIRWSVFAGGKRIRPALLYATGHALLADPVHLARIGAAIEMIHTYSLIHDDLPSMDDDDLRRGRASCHKQFGEATAVLAGDALQSLAFGAVAGDINLTADVRIKLIALLAVCAGTPAGMVSGQFLDLEAEGVTLSAEQISQVHSQKTGALITASVLGGGIIGDATEAEMTALQDFSCKLGRLFQMTDDLLDATQPSATLGKTAGKDVVSQKATLIAGGDLAWAIGQAQGVYDEACRALAPIERDTRYLNSLAYLILHRTS